MNRVHFQTMTKAPVKFQNNHHKMIGGFAHARYLLSIHIDSDNA